MGLGLRLSFLRNRARVGAGAARAAVFKRAVLLMVVAVFVYHFNARRIFWDALTQIGFGTLVALPFVYAAAVLAGGQPRIWGVPFELESASWPLMILMGTIAADWLLEGAASARKPLVCGSVLLAAGLGVYFFGPPTAAACAPLTTLGRNALVVCALHYSIDDDMRRLIPDSAGAAAALLSFAVVAGACWAVAKYLQNRNWYVTL